MFKLLRNLLILVTLVTPYVSHAQDKSQNGGDSDEIEFLLIAKKINQWFRIEKNIARYDDELTRADLTTQVNAEKVKSVLASITDQLSITFVNHELHLPINKHGDNGTPQFITRVCVNFSTADGMVCDRKAWSTSPDTNKYLLVFHEMMGASGIEYNLTPDSGFSLYDFTLALSPFINEIKNEVVIPNITLKCADSDYSLQLMNGSNAQTHYTLFINDHPVIGRKIIFKILDLTNNDSDLPRAYLQIETGLFHRRTILQCNP